MIKIIILITLCSVSSCSSFSGLEFKDIDSEPDGRKILLDVEFTDKDAYFSDSRMPARLRKNLKDADSEIPVRIHLRYLKRRETETESVSPFLPYLYYIRTRQYQHSFEYLISSKGCAHTERRDSDHNHTVDEYKIKRPLDFITAMTSWTLFISPPNYFVGIGSLAFFFSPAYLNRHQMDIFHYEKELTNDIINGVKVLGEKCSRL